jgi:hypothetical protein
VAGVANGRVPGRQWQDIGSRGPGMSHEIDSVGE